MDHATLRFDENGTRLPAQPNPRHTSRTASRSRHTTRPSSERTPLQNAPTRKGIDPQDLVSLRWAFADYFPHVPCMDVRHFGFWLHRHPISTILAAFETLATNYPDIAIGNDPDYLGRVLFEMLSTVVYAQ